MGLHKIDIEEIKEKLNMEWESPDTIGRRVISQIIQNINIEYQKGLSGGLSSELLIHPSLIDYVTNTSSYVVGGMSNFIDEIQSINEPQIIGSLMGHLIYVMDSLKIDEYFIGSVKDFEIYKRKDKIIKILQR